MQCNILYIYIYIILHCIMLIKYIYVYNNKCMPKINIMFYIILQHVIIYYIKYFEIFNISTHMINIGFSSLFI